MGVKRIGLVLAPSVALGLLAVALLTHRGTVPTVDEERSIDVAPGVSLQVSIDETRARIADHFTELTTQITPLEVAHAGLALGFDHEARDHVTGARITLLQYFQRNRYAGAPIFVVAPDGVRPHNSTNGEIERHQDQLLAYFALGGLTADTQIQADSSSVPISQLVRQTKRRINSGQEQAWTLAALLTYCDIADEWQNEFGARCSLLGLTRTALQAIDDPGACDGAHRLYALALAVTSINSQPDAPPEATELARQISVALRERMSMLSKTGLVHVEARQVSSDGDIHFVGHQLEWIAEFAAAEELAAPWITEAVSYLCRELTSRQERLPGVATWGHAIHALQRYRTKCNAPADSTVTVRMPGRFHCSATIRDESASID